MLDIKTLTPALAAVAGAGNTRIATDDYSPASGSKVSLMALLDQQLRSSEVSNYRAEVVVSAAVFLA